MKKNIILFTSLLLLLSFDAVSQSLITLDDCQQKAHDNYPLIKQYDLIRKTEQFTLDNVSKGYLPQAVFNAQATYQTDVPHLVVDVPIPSFEIPRVNKDQYRATLDVSQVVWDGGAIRSQQKTAKANTEVENLKVEVSLYAIREKINQLYFGILAVDEQLKIIDMLQADLQANYDLASSMFKNGVATQSDVDLAKVSLLNLEQNRTEQIAARKAYLKVLSLFVNQQLDASVTLQKPIDHLDMNAGVNRPELLLYNKQRSYFDAQESVVVAKNLPKLSLFAQGGYGNPGLNMLVSKFELFAMGGVKLTWNFGNLYTRSNEKKLIKNNRMLTDIQEETFLFNANIQLNQIQIEAQKYKQLMKNDDEIVDLRNRVKIAGESKYKNGVYQMNELIRDINAANQASLTKALHQVQYLMSIYNYKYTQGN